MEETINYKLKKPDNNNYVDIEDLNYNADIIDTKLKESESHLADMTQQIENTKGTISSSSGIKSVTTTHNKQVNCSENSTVDSSYSQVNCSMDATANSLYSQVNCSRNSTANLLYSQVNCGIGVMNNKAYTIIGGFGSTIEEASTKNIKWELSSKEGTIKASGTITGNSTFADFAEYFESVDGTKIKTGTIVTLGNDKIRPCEQGEEMLGVISETAGVLLNASGFYWQDRYIRNEFGGLVYKEILDEETQKYIKVLKENKEHDIEEEYIAREEREEWNVVGLTGQVYVRIDCTVVVGDFIKSNNEGIATKNNDPTWQRWKVMKITTPYSEEKKYGVALVFIR